MMGQNPSENMMDKMFTVMSAEPETRKFMAQRILRMITEHPQEFKTILNENPELRKRLEELIK